MAFLGSVGSLATRYELGASPLTCEADLARYPHAHRRALVAQREPLLADS